MTRKAKVSRPNMPKYGILDENSGKGLLPWSWVQERLEQARFYWIGTTRPDGRPHSMPIWAIWVDDVLYFSSGRESRKNRNLQVMPECVISVQSGNDSVIVEGKAVELLDRAQIARLSAIYNAKYKWELNSDLGPIYMVEPRVVFGFDESDFVESSTRWIFREE